MKYRELAASTTPRATTAVTSPLRAKLHPPASLTARPRAPRRLRHSHYYCTDFPDRLRPRNLRRRHRPHNIRRLSHHLRFCTLRQHLSRRGSRAFHVRDGAETASDNVRRCRADCKRLGRLESDNRPEFSNVGGAIRCRCSR